MTETRLNITAVERDVGLSKDVLRVWERRYGFPTPERDANGERLYPLPQVERLRVIKRLLDQGHRPGRLVGASDEALSGLIGARPTVADTHGAENFEALKALLALIQHNDPTGYTQALQQRLAREGLQSFVQDTMAPLTTLVGLAWEQGQLEVFEEHLFTELSKRVLRQAISGVAGGRSPRVLLTTLPEEPHALGLLMAESVMAIDGAHCIPLGTQMPMVSIVEAARAHRADVVALSFSAAFPSRRIAPMLLQLRGLLPPAVALWVGGSGAARLGPQPGIRTLESLTAIQTALADWRRSAETSAA